MTTADPDPVTAADRAALVTAAVSHVPVVDAAPDTQLPDRWTQLRDRLHEALLELEDSAVAVVLGALQPVLDRVVAQVVGGNPIVALSASAMDDLSSIINQWGEAVDERVLPHYRAVFEAGGWSAVQQMADLGGPGEDWFEEIARPYLREAAGRHLATARNRFLQVGDGAWTEARAVLLDGLDHGIPVDRIARNLRGVTELTRAQATMVARTEVISAANAGAWTQARMAGDEAPLFKQWLATMDERTRPSHMDADMQVQALSDPFILEHGSLQYPGDPSAPMVEVVNCRCSIVFTDNPDGEAQMIAGRQTGG